MSAPLPIAVVGLNFGLHILRDQLPKPEVAEFVKPVMICDRSPEALARAEFSKVPATREYDEVLANPDVAAVALFLPPRGRAEFVRKALRAGKPVLATKPFERSSAAAETVLREAREAGLAVHCNSPAPQTSPLWRQLFVWRDQFQLGRVALAHWETWGDYHETADGSWLDREADCPIAPIFRLGIYGINEMIRLGGAAEQVTALGGRMRTGRPTPDNGVLTMRFAEGGVGIVAASLCVKDNPPYRNKLTIHFERGSITRLWENIEPSNNNTDLEKMKIVLQLSVDGAIHRAEFPLNDNGGDYQWQYFRDSVAHYDLAAETEYHKLIVNGLRVIEQM